MAIILRTTPAENKMGSLSRQKRTFRTVAYVFMITYALLTLFPFYILFVRTFVSTKDSIDLHLWIPRGEELSMDAEIGNLAVNYNVDIKKLKTDLGIKGYLNPRDSLKVIAEKNNVPIESSKTILPTSAPSTAGSPSWAGQTTGRRWVARQSPRSSASSCSVFFRCSPAMACPGCAGAIRWSSTTSICSRW